MKNNFFKINTISNFFVVLSFIGMILYYLKVYLYFTPNSYILLFLRTIFFTFIHGGIYHFFGNTIFLLYFGNLLEKNIGKTKYMFLFIFSVIFISIGLIFLKQFYTIGISGFCMAILGYYLMSLKEKNDPELLGGIMFMIVNLAAGFHANISFWGHFLGAVAGIVFYYISVSLLKNKS